MSDLEVNTVRYSHIKCIPHTALINILCLIENNFHHPQNKLHTALKIFLHLHNIPHEGSVRMMHRNLSGGV